MYVWSLESTQEARVALGYASSNSYYASPRALQTLRLLSDGLESDDLSFQVTKVNQASHFSV